MLDPNLNSEPMCIDNPQLCKIHQSNYIYRAACLVCRYRLAAKKTRDLE